MREFLWNIHKCQAGTDMGACRTVPQVSYLTQVLRQVVLVVSLIGQLQVATERVQPHWISPAEAESGHYSMRLMSEQITQNC